MFIRPVPAVHREARFFRIRVAVSTEKSVLLDTPTSRKQVVGGFMNNRHESQSVPEPFAFCVVFRRQSSQLDEHQAPQQRSIPRLSNIRSLTALAIANSP